MKKVIFGIFILLIFGDLNSQNTKLEFFEDATQLYFEAKDSSNFFKATSKYLELDTTNWRIYLNRGVFLSEVCEKYLDAINDLKKARNLNKESHNPLAELGLTYFKLKQFDISKKYLDSAVQIEKTNYYLYYKIGFIHGMENQMDSSLKYMTISEKLKPDFPPIYFSKGYSYMMKKDFSVALKEFDKALKLDSTYFEVYCTKANVLISLGKLTEAKKSLDKALLYSDSPMIDFFYSRYYLEVGNKEKACFLLKRSKDRGYEDAIGPYEDICK